VFIGHGFNKGAGVDMTTVLTTVTVKGFCGAEAHPEKRRINGASKKIVFFIMLTL
jgi:hypothetical protein